MVGNSSPGRDVTCGRIIGSRLRLMGKLGSEVGGCAIWSKVLCLSESSFLINKMEM